ncbi:MAG: hypothetical protein U5L10_03950 [Candidatus Moranbacteria bacterium]|nr:hypothetical protein [Candidatus Moranbacteria bacterium]
MEQLYNFAIGYWSVACFIGGFIITLLIIGAIGFAVWLYFVNKCPKCGGLGFEEMFGGADGSVCVKCGWIKESDNSH